MLAPSPLILPASYRGYSLWSLLGKLGLQGSCKLCVDAGDEVSYPGSGQNLVDRSGGSPSNLFLGADATATNDPAYLGTAGRRSSGEYFTPNNNGVFHYQGASNETWMENLHKATAKWGYCGAIDIGSVASSHCFFGTKGSVSSSPRGVAMWFGGATPVLNLRVGNGAASSLSVTSVATLPRSNTRPSVVGLSVDEAAGTGFFYINGTVEAFTSTYSSPSASAAATVFDLCGAGGAATNLSLGNTNLDTKFFAGAMWEGRAPSAGEIAALEAAFRERIGG